MRLIHFSDEAITHFYSSEQTTNAMKPRGLWVSVEGNGDGWSDWCEAEGFRDTDEQLAYEIELKDDAKILYINKAVQLKAFTKRYKSNDQPHGLTAIYNIDWSRVAKLYQGIIITPYLSTVHMDYDNFWYYGWDCASGCIWQPDAIKSYKAVMQKAGRTI